LVRVDSRRGFAAYPALVTTRVRPGECFAPIHWNDQFGENLVVNVATSEAVDPISLQPEFKFTAVKLSKVAAGVLDQFSAEQKNYLLRFLGEIQPNGVVVPATAPFSQAQREYIGQVLGKRRKLQSAE